MQYTRVLMIGGPMHGDILPFDPKGVMPPQIKHAGSQEFRLGDFVAFPAHEPTTYYPHLLSTRVHTAEVVYSCLPWSEMIDALDCAFMDERRLPEDIRVNRISLAWGLSLASQNFQERLADLAVKHEMKLRGFGNHTAMAIDWYAAGRLTALDERNGHLPKIHSLYHFLQRLIARWRLVAGKRTREIGA